jgi:hypothetical protein
MGTFIHDRKISVSFFLFSHQKVDNYYQARLFLCLFFFFLERELIQLSGVKQLSSTFLLN